MILRGEGVKEDKRLKCAERLFLCKNNGAGVQG